MSLLPKPTIDVIKLDDHIHSQQVRRAITTDDGIALAFAAQHAATLRYVALWNRWLRFDGTRWAPDETRHAFDLVRDFCREFRRHDGVDNRKALESAKTIGAVHTLAQSDRRIAARPEQWDSDPDVFNEGERTP